jgi:hypothetical protein
MVKLRVLNNEQQNISHKMMGRKWFCFVRTHFILVKIQTKCKVSTRKKTRNCTSALS